MAVDPWAGFYKGNEDLNNTLVRVRGEDRQSAIDTQNAASARQQLAMGAIQLQGAQDKQQNLQDARTAYANAQGQIVQVPTGQMQDVPGSDVGPGAPIPGPALPNKPAGRQQLYDIPQQAPMVEGPQPTMAQVPVMEDKELPPTEMDRTAAMAKSYMSNGAVDDAKKIIIDGGAITDMLAKMKAKTAEYGSPEQAAQFDSKIEHMTKVEGLLDSLRKADPSMGLMKQYITTHPDMFVGIDPNKLGMSASGMVSWPIDQNGVQGIGYLDTDGKIKFQAANEHRNQTWSEPYIANVGGKKVLLQKSSTGETKQVSADQSVTVRNLINNSRDSKGSLSVDAVDLAAQTYLTTGKMPAFGNGGAMQKMAVLNRAATMAKEQGLDASGIISQAADTAAQAGGLKKVTAQYAMVQSFEKTASKNFDLVEKLYDRNPQSTIMLLNKLKNNVNIKITGDPDTVMAGRALQTALMEYAKVVTGQTGGAAVSDSARKEVESLLSLADKPATFHGTIANHRLEMQNRMTSFQETIASLKSGSGGAGKGPLTQAEAQGYLQKAGGNKDRARKMAAADGRSF
jgi:hypothetical protein